MRNHLSLLIKMTALIFVIKLHHVACNAYKLITHMQRISHREARLSHIQELPIKVQSSK